VDSDDDERVPVLAPSRINRTRPLRSSPPICWHMGLTFSPGWFAQARKQSFVRHTVREYHIHKALDHPNVVRLHDVFEIDANTFCTVLDYCAPPFPRLPHQPSSPQSPEAHVCLLFSLAARKREVRTMCTRRPQRRLGRVLEGAPDAVRA
jgi:serine/threonine protein kinase